jgi:hypothetical protein
VVRRFVSLLALLAFLLNVLTPIASAETARLVERNGDEVTYAEGYWRLITAQDGKIYRAFFITQRAVSSKGRVHEPPEVFIDLSDYRTETKTVIQTVTATQEEIIRSPAVLSVSQYAVGSGKMRVSLKNDCLYAGERVRVNLLSPGTASQELTLAANGGTGEAVLQTTVCEPKTETVSLEAVVTENLDPQVAPGYRYPSGLKTTWSGPVTFQFNAPRVVIAPSGMDAVVQVTNQNEVRGQIQAYWELRWVSSGSLIRNGFFTTFGSADAWWDGYQTRSFNFARPQEAYTASVRLSVNTRFGNSSGPTASADYVFEMNGPEITYADQGTTVVVTVTNRNSFGGNIRVYIAHDGVGVYGPTTMWFNAGESKSFTVGKNLNSAGSHTISTNARFNPDSGPNTIRDYTYTIYAPEVTASDMGTYVRFAVRNPNSFGGNVRVYITHDGSGVYGPTTSWFGAGESRIYDVTKKTSPSGWHTVSCNARFNPDAGPNTIRDFTYYVQPPAQAPSISYSDLGSSVRITVTNTNSFGGYVRIYATHDGSTAFGPQDYWLNGGASYSFNITKKTSSGYHTISTNARFDPPSGPNTIKDFTYYVQQQSNEPPYVYTSGGTVYVKNPASQGGWFRVYDYNTGQYLAGSATSEQYIGPGATWSRYVGYGHSGAFKGWNYDKSRMNNDGWST